MLLISINYREDKPVERVLGNIMDAFLTVLMKNSADREDREVDTKDGRHKQVNYYADFDLSSLTEGTEENV